MENEENKTATEKEIEVASKEVLEKHHKAFENLADNEKKEDNHNEEHEKILDEAMEFLKQKMEEHVDVLKRLAKK
jgi:hypothetical protein